MERTVPLSHTAPALPLRIGRYRVVQRLGEGATSEVFLAHDPVQDQPVAIKRVRSGPGRGAVEQHFAAHFFAAEAALVGRLKHPNVVPLLDAVDDPQGAYLVMDYVPGTTLRTFCQPGRLLSLEQVVEIGFKCAMALGYLYRQGVIHRDVKPANILAVLDGEVVTDVKISDFGSALRLDAERTQIHRVGSLAYMSPEQLDGATLDGRADMYSLAAVLYHMVAGRPPFEAPCEAALLKRIAQDIAMPLTDLREDVSPALDATLRVALNKARSDRPASWDVFAQSLAALIANGDVPRGQIQRVADSERFNLLRSLRFFERFDDLALWEVVHRARWQRLFPGHCIYRAGEQGNQFHIIATGVVEVFRGGQRVASLKSGTSVGEMAYLAPNPELGTHSADVVVAEATTTISFTPQSLAALSAATRHAFDQAFIQVLVRRLHAAHEALAHPRRIM
ncbi:MAG: serine/threonine-protein kinase [Proteobacteria bacterium]|nr:serine/threonine-protein kinase [Pseudomonadota bacterium]